MTGFNRTEPLGRRIVRLLLVALYLAAGVMHLTRPEPFIAITPPWVPAAPLVITLTGLAELAGAIGLLQGWSPALRRAAGWGLAAYALCVWPANVQHMLLDLTHHGLSLAYHVPRLAAQPLLIWAAPWAAGCFGSGRRPAKAGTGRTPPA
jgi:uncharacterized membrane protein